MALTHALSRRPLLWGTLNSFRASQLRLSWTAFVGKGIPASCNPPYPSNSKLIYQNTEAMMLSSIRRRRASPGKSMELFNPDNRAVLFSSTTS